METESGLTDQAILAKINKIRELNVGSIIPLPQLIVVGDQSSGKSSVLESLTGFSFPRAAGLCTRYATQISSRYELQSSVYVSIIPRPDADKALKTRLLKFQRRLTEFDNNELARIFDEAHRVMNIRMSTDGSDTGVGAFSQDILKIEISGPEQNYLTVIDVPGIFRVPTEGKKLLNMVKSYMGNSRTIILAVMPCNVDITTQEILKFAEEADPSGVRTMGVLTKPDLATEKATQDAVMDLLLERRNILKLGYHVVKNRSADSDLDMSAHLADEAAFFTAPPWSAIPDRCGISSLKTRLRELLMLISRRELGPVKFEIEGRLRKCRAELEVMGPARDDPNAQRRYLGNLATQFQKTSLSARNGNYAEDNVFDQPEPNLKLITKIVKLNEIFADTFWRRGHKHHFGAAWNDEDEPSFGSDTDHPLFEVSLEAYPELHDIVEADEYTCSEPLKGPIMSLIEEVFVSSRGPEIGTFGGTLLATIFKVQSEKWEPLVFSHTSKAIILVHDYIFQLLTKLCPEQQVKTQLWEGLLVHKLCNAYHRAMDHARFLLAIERGSGPTTFNHYFNANLQKKRNERMCKSLQALAVSNTDGKQYVPIKAFEQHSAINKDNRQQVCEDILDTLISYYEVARKRFVDVVCQQVIYYFLMDTEDAPLRILSPGLVMRLCTEDLEMVAGEDAESRRRRDILKREMDSLEEALRVLRS
ncbi:hypothetical protein BDV12DRAFT_197247 [Aspergillus spectabilis]